MVPVWGELAIAVVFTGIRPARWANLPDSVAKPMARPI